MPVKRQVPDKLGIYFITFTCYRWRHLFELTHGYDIVYKWFEWLQAQGNFVLGFVIMPNHVHAILAFPKLEKPLSTIISNGKRFMSYQIVNRLTRAGQLDLLLEMARGVPPSDFRRNKRHKVFEASFDWKRCDAEWFVEQKLEYIHQNPCKGIWELAQCPEEYQHSSANFYAIGEQGIIHVDHYLDVLEMKFWLDE